jgi:fibronectin type 3 domain-containing protein
MRLVDNAFVWEKTYDYRVNVTTRFTTGAPHACPGESNPLPACKDSIDVEGEDSVPATVVAHDTFPPAVTTALQAVFSGAGQKPFIDLTWNANTDADLTGYNVYRRDGTGQPARVNNELVRAPAFRDVGVASGKAYFYSVSAIDGRGNESGRSEEATETVP